MRPGGSAAAALVVLHALADQLAALPHLGVGERVSGIGFDPHARFHGGHVELGCGDLREPALRVRAEEESRVVAGSAPACVGLREALPKVFDARAVDRIGHRSMAVRTALPVGGVIE